jgi:hypothetical protein
MIHDLNDFARPADLTNGAVMSTCMTCGVTQPQGERHVCKAAGEAKRRRRRETAAKRYNRIRAKLGRPGRIFERCDFCGQDVEPTGHACLPDQRPMAPQFSSNWLAGSQWQQQSAPPIHYHHNPVEGASE